MGLFASKAEREAIERCRQRKIENERLVAEVADLKAHIAELERRLAEVKPVQSITPPPDDRYYRRVADGIVADLKIQHPEWFDVSPLGVDTLNCPYCAGELQKYPLRKIACPHCGKSIYPRKRPQDGARVIIKESDLDVFELQAAYHCTGLWLRQVDAAVNQLEECRKYDGYWLFASFGWLTDRHNARVVCGSAEEREYLEAIFAPGFHAAVSYPPGHFERRFELENDDDECCLSIELPMTEGKI